MANYFTDRVVQYPGRVVMTPVQGEANTYDMARAEGNVTTEGTRFNAATFNQIAEDIIQDADDNIITDAELTAIKNILGASDNTLYDILNAMIPESGSNANGQYTKFPDGTMICTKRVSGTYNFSRAFGSWWETASAVSLGNWPATFVAAPTIIATSEGAYAQAEAFNDVTGSSAGVTYLMRPDKVSKQLTIALTAIGKWK